jgi:hypothetical protein
MAVRRFKVGDLCVHRGFICRVDRVEREFAKGLSYMGVKDGTEFNPTLYMTPLYGVTGDPVKKVKVRSACSGSVGYAHMEVLEMENQVRVLQKKIALLREGPPSPSR